MKSSTTPSFWRAYRSLSAEIQAEANKTYSLWKENPRHPSLHFAPKGEYWSVRISADGGLWEDFMMARSTGSGLARTMSTKGS
jgi:hypothetical protein